MRDDGQHRDPLPGSALGAAVEDSDTSSWIARLVSRFGRARSLEGCPRSGAPARVESEPGGSGGTAGNGQSSAPAPIAEVSAEPELSSNGALDALARALSAPEAARRAAALELVCEFTLDHSAALLRPMFYDPEVEVRLAAARAATRLGLLELLPPLISALEDPEVDVRRAAACALESITGHHVAAEPERDGEYATSADALKRWWKERRLRELRESASGAA